MTSWEDWIHRTGTGSYQLGKSNPVWRMTGRKKKKVGLTFWKANSSAVLSPFQGEKKNVSEHPMLPLDEGKITAKGQNQKKCPKMVVKTTSPDYFFRPAFFENISFLPVMLREKNSHQADIVSQKLCYLLTVFWVSDIKGLFIQFTMDLFIAVPSSTYKSGVDFGDLDLRKYSWRSY